MNVAEYIRNREKAKNKPETDRQSPLRGGVFDRYSGYSEEQLLGELFRLGSLSSGNVSARDLDGFFNRARPFLTPEQAAKMADLIRQLKNS